MANMALNIEQRLGQKLTNEQQILWNYMIQRWSNLILEPLFYQGAIAGSELATYAANKLYVSYQSTVVGLGTATAGVPYFGIYNELNVIVHLSTSNAVYWDATAAGARYFFNTHVFNNFYFGRIAASNIQSITFIGYRLTI